MVPRNDGDVHADPVTNAIDNSIRRAEAGIADLRCCVPVRHLNEPGTSWFPPIPRGRLQDEQNG